MSRPSTPADTLGSNLTRSEVSKLLRISIDTLARRERAGDGPPRMRIGRRLIYPRSAVEAWAKMHLIP